MIIHAVVVKNITHERDQEDYLNRWGIHGWEFAGSEKVNNGIKFVFKKQYDDAIPYENILSFIEEIKKEAAETKAHVMLKNKVKRKK